MSIRNILAVLRRHIIAVGVLLAFSSAAVLFVWTKAPSAYQSEATLVILRPNVAFDFEDQPFAVNPYQNLADPSVQVAASVIASVANGGEFKDRLSELGVTSDTDVQVAADATGESFGGVGVFLRLTALNQEPRASSDDLAIISDALAEELELRQRQAGAPEETLLTLAPLSPPTQPQFLASDRVQLSGITVIVNLIVTTLAIAGLEFAYRRRDRARKTGAVGKKDAEEPGTSADTENAGVDEAPNPDAENYSSKSRNGHLDHTAASLSGSSHTRLWGSSTGDRHESVARTSRVPLLESKP